MWRKLSLSQPWKIRFKADYEYWLCRIWSLLPRSAAREGDLMVGDHPLQFSVFLYEEMQVRILLLVTSTKYRQSRWALKSVYYFISPGLAEGKSESHDASGQVLRVGRQEGQLAGCAAHFIALARGLEPQLQGSGADGKPSALPLTAPSGLRSPSVTLQTQQPLPQHFQQSTSDYLFMTLQHSFSSNFMAFH